VDSAGVSVTPGLFADAGAWHQWWSLVGGKLVFIPHHLNPASIDYYDYTEMTWYERPLASGQPELIGPYIDFGGADMKIVTASRPALQDTRAVAVAGGGPHLSPVAPRRGPLIGRRRWLRFRQAQPAAVSTSSTSGG
jgi:hypothetical protein